MENDPLLEVNPTAHPPCSVPLEFPQNEPMFPVFLVTSKPAAGLPHLPAGEAVQVCCEL